MSDCGETHADVDDAVSVGVLIAAKKGAVAQRWANANAEKATAPSRRHSRAMPGTWAALSQRRRTLRAQRVLCGSAAIWARNGTRRDSSAVTREDQNVGSRE